MAEILVVEDDESLNKLICKALKIEKYKVKGVKTISDTLEAIRESDYDLVILDIMLPDGNGMEIMEKLLERSTVIVISAHGDINVAVKAVQMGAFNFMPKPFELASLITEVGRALESRELRRENISLKLPTKLVGESPAMRKLRDVIKTVSSRNVTVLVEGESGTGKELVARSIWELSDRSKDPFIAVNCGAIPLELFESELFGYEKGAFTGASKSKPGKFELANKGVLFLDEIGDLPKSVQVKLLRVLETSEIERLGGVKSNHVDVRVISATNKGLEEEVEKGNFREDLYYRINVVKIEVPPLRERIEDIPILVDHFSRIFANQMGVKFKFFTEKAVEALKEYPFPGNVRELQNVVRSAMVFSKSDKVDLDALPPKIVGAKKNHVQIPIGVKLEDAERMLITATLEHFGGNKTQTAKTLGIGLSTLHNKLNQWREEGAKKD